MNNLNLIIGENDKLVSFYLQDILKKIKEDNIDTINYNLKEVSFSIILDEASMISLFSNKKIIIGTNFDISKLTDKEIDYLNKYLNNINKDIYIILIANKVDGRVKTYKIFKEKFNIIETTKNDITDDLYNYIKKRIQDNNYKIDNSNIEYFLHKTGNDINNINSELDKLFIYKEDNKIILREDIDLLITDNIDNIIYEFTNAILDKDINTVIKMYNNFKIENVGIDYLLVSLSNVFRQSLIIKLLNNEHKSNLEISKIIGKKEYYVKKMLERLYQYTIDDLSNIINKLFTIDLNNKTGVSNYDELELFLITMN